MSNMDKTGKKVPDVMFKIREDDHWVTKNSDDIFKNRRVILFALPGAYTPTCSQVHLPTYNEFADTFRANGIDDIICLSVNDSYVLNEWKSDSQAEKITMLPDGNAEFTTKLGFLTDKSDECLGSRSWRYSMLVDNGIIKKMFIEPEGEEDPYGVSGPEHMLQYIAPDAKIPDAVSIFVRRGCSYCARAKELLQEKNLQFEELVFNEDFTIKTLRAISGSTKLPQVFMNGRRIGGAEELENIFGKSKAAA